MFSDAGLRIGIYNGRRAATDVYLSQKEGRRVSDIVLILNTFGDEFKQNLRNTNIGLYYAGQILIALSLQLLK